jgi:hypothetical protein
MQVGLNGPVGLISLVISSVAAAQAQPSAQQTTSTTTQQMPDQTQTTTTRSTTTAVPGTPAAPAQTQTTTTRSTATTPTDSATGAPIGPTERSTSTSTTTTSVAAVQPATAADVKAGVSVYDQKGGMVGKIESVNAKGAVVSTGVVKATIPISSFAKSDKGLVIGMTKAELDASAKAKTRTTKPK